MNKIEDTARRLKLKMGFTDTSFPVVVIRPVFNAILKVFYGRTGLQRNVQAEEPLLIYPEHRYFRDDFESDLLRYLKQTIKPGDVVVEVGANVGFFTTMLARWVGLSGHVYAFEPSPISRDTLFKHLLLNNMADRVTVSPMAISDRSGTAVFYQNGNSGENTLSPGHRRLPRAKATPVQVTTLDEFCGAGEIIPTIIKIDIEGYEFHALKGSSKILESLRPIVVVEMHPFNWDEIGVSSREISELVTAVRYQIRPIGPSKDPLSTYGHAVLEPSERVRNG